MSNKSLHNTYTRNVSSVSPVCHKRLLDGAVSRNKYTCGPKTKREMILQSFIPALIDDHYVESPDEKRNLVPW